MTVSDLGVLIDGQLSMADHVTSLCRSCFFQLRQLRLVRSSLTPDVAKHWCMHSSVATWITATACCAVSVTAWWRSSRPSRNRQLVLWLVPGLTPVLRDLHWLPVRHRIDSKVAMTVFKCIHGLAPQYLADDCVLASTVRSRRHFAVRWHHETGGAADKDRHRHQGLCSRCCYCMEQTTSWHSNLYVHGADICTKTENFLCQPAHLRTFYFAQ